ncbi:MAG: LytR C-terminal domain-containing protein [candidate division WOR-3 bacterium]|nr:MAG: LytR C-terminal domain-containing protein [candidate division WOR-3 bacterium]
MKSSGKVLLYLLVIILAAFLISIIFMYTRENPEAIRKKNSTLRVEVLNGCGENRLALKVANVLRRQGFNVVKIGNATQSDFEKTVVIERSSDDYSNAKYFARRIKCKYIGKDIDPALHLEVSLILGLDYSRYFTNLSEEF